MGARTRVPTMLNWRLVSTNVCEREETYRVRGVQKGDSYLGWKLAVGLCGVIYIYTYTYIYIYIYMYIC